MNHASKLISVACQDGENEYDNSPRDHGRCEIGIDGDGS